jgi:hypothetical protein
MFSERLPPAFHKFLNLADIYFIEPVRLSNTAR